MLAERLTKDGSRFASGWNFGPADNDAKPVSWIADELARLWGDQASWSRDAAAHPREAHFLKLDASKARSCLGWCPVLPLDSALGWVVEWWREFQAAGDLSRITGTQIERYEALSRNGSTSAALERKGEAAGSGPTP
jgi:CDP-glucose 4,6-dehydratase